MSDIYRLITEAWEALLILGAIGFVTLRLLWQRVSTKPTTEFQLNEYAILILTFLGSGFAIAQLRHAAGEDFIDGIRARLAWHASDAYQIAKLDELLDRIKDFQSSRILVSGGDTLSDENSQLLLRSRHLQIVDFQPELLNGPQYERLRQALFVHGSTVKITRIFVANTQKDACDLSLLNHYEGDPSDRPTKLSEKFLPRREANALLQSRVGGRRGALAAADSLLFLYDDAVLLAAFPDSQDLTSVNHLEILWESQRIIGAELSREREELTDFVRDVTETSSLKEVVCETRNHL